MKKNKRNTAAKAAKPAAHEFDVQMLSALKKIKAESGLTYEQMGRLANVGSPTLARWFTQGIGRVHRATRIQVGRFIDGYQKAKETRKLGLFLKGGGV